MHWVQAMWPDNKYWLLLRMHCINAENIQMFKKLLKRVDFFYAIFGKGLILRLNTVQYYI